MEEEIPEVWLERELEKVGDYSQSINHKSVDMFSIVLIFSSLISFSKKDSYLQCCLAPFVI